MKESLLVTRDTLRRLFFQRCFYLFFMLLALVAAAPFIDSSPRGILLRNALNAFIMISAVAAVGRSAWSFMLVLAMATLALVARWASLENQDSLLFEISLRLDALVYAATIVLLLRYVFDRSVMTSDRLWGAAAAFLMMGVLWSFLYALIDGMTAGAFSVRGSLAPMDFTDLIYFSFSTLTTTGFGDIVPVSRFARSAATVESIIGQLFLAILIARLVGVYPTPGRESPATPGLDAR